MATLQEVEAIANNNQILITAIQDNTIEPSALTGIQRKKLEDAIYPLIGGYRAIKGVSNNNYAAWEVDDQLMHIDNTGKRQVLGQVITIPFNPATDLDDTSKFDKYQDNKPSF